MVSLRPLRVATIVPSSGTKQRMYLSGLDVIGEDLIREIFRACYEFSGDSTIDPITYLYDKSRIHSAFL